MAKPTKSKVELRSLILSEIAGHPVCPAGMDVSIEATYDGGWQALSISPGPIAHADCVDYIGKVTQRLRLEYDLAPEPQPQTSWKNATDDATNKAIQARNVALCSRCCRKQHDAMGQKPT